MEAQQSGKLVRIGYLHSIGRADPVEAGLVESLARPRGNLTGLTNIAVALTSKRLELFKEALPRLTRIDAIYDPAILSNLQEARDIHKTRALLGLTSKSWEVRGAGDFDKVFTALSKDRPDGLYVPGGPTLRPKWKLIADFTLKNRVPSIYVNKDGAAVGALMSYGHSLSDHYRRAAWHIERIIKGAEPADLPVEQPKKFELVINLETAKQIGVTIPPNVLVRADRVIR